MDIALIFVVSSLEDSFDDVSTARIHAYFFKIFPFLPFLNPKKVLFRVYTYKKYLVSVDGHVENVKFCTFLSACLVSIFIAFIRAREERLVS